MLDAGPGTTQLPESLSSTLLSGRIVARMKQMRTVCMRCLAVEASIALTGNTVIACSLQHGPQLARCAVRARLDLTCPVGGWFHAQTPKDTLSLQATRQGTQRMAFAGVFRSFLTTSRMTSILWSHASLGWSASKVQSLTHCRGFKRARRLCMGDKTSDHGKCYHFAAVARCTRREERRCRSRKVSSEYEVGNSGCCARASPGQPG